MRVLAVIFGVLLLLPGLCFLGFGASFTFSGYGMTAFGLLELAIGGLITWGAVLLIINYSKPR
ncbi:MAG TPA: hypothetical protein VFE64_10370 [Devosia sp.]|jgi:hypothetical protein|nr:hypothetical protein [Devosia sp.]